MFTFLVRAFSRIGHLLLHKTLFGSRSGEVYFYGLDEETEKEPFDGKVVVMDQRFKAKKVFGYRFDNRWMVHASPAERTMAVWSAILAVDMTRPLMVIERSRGFTPFGQYETVPKPYQRLIQETLKALESEEAALTSVSL